MVDCCCLVFGVFGDVCALCKFVVACCLLFGYCCLLVVVCRAMCVVHWLLDVLSCSAFVTPCVCDCLWFV